MGVTEHRKPWSLYWCEGYSLLTAPFSLPPFYSLHFSALLCDLRRDSPWTKSLDSFIPKFQLGWVNGRNRHEMGGQKENIPRYFPPHPPFSDHGWVLSWPQLPLNGPSLLHVPTPSGFYLFPVFSSTIEMVRDSCCANLWVPQHLLFVLEAQWSFH